jgi:DNA-binding MarR family transcriptional regulator
MAERYTQGDPSVAGPSERPGGLLFLASQAAQQLANERLSPLGITAREFGVLTLLARAGQLSQQAIGEQLRIDRTTMVAMVDVLEQAGFVRRERNPTDRRAYAVKLTPRGRARQRRGAETLENARDEFFAPLSKREREQLLAMLERLVLREGE